MWAPLGTQARLAAMDGAKVLLEHKLCTGPTRSSDTSSASAPARKKYESHADIWQRLWNTLTMTTLVAWPCWGCSFAPGGRAAAGPPRLAPYKSGKNPKTYGKAYGIKESDPQAGPQMLHGGGGGRFFSYFGAKSAGFHFLLEPNKSCASCSFGAPWWHEAKGGLYQKYKENQ